MLHSPVFAKFRIFVFDILSHATQFLLVMSQPVVLCLLSSKHRFMATRACSLDNDIRVQRLEMFSSNTSWNLLIGQMLETNRFSSQRFVQLGEQPKMTQLANRFPKTEGLSFLPRGNYTDHNVNQFVSEAFYHRIKSACRETGVVFRISTNKNKYWRLLVP